MLHTSEQNLLASNRLLLALSELQSAFIQGALTPGLFHPLLSVLLELTGSEWGFIVEVGRDAEGQPTLQPHALSSVARAPCPEEASRGPRLSALQSLCRAALTRDQPVVSHHLLPEELDGGDALLEPRDSSTFLALPLRSGGEQVGLVGLANRPDGYDEEVLALLEPCLAPCGSLLAGLRERRRMQERLLVMERMASVGTLTAGMAHEINNPLAYMLSNLTYVTEELRTLIDTGTPPTNEQIRELLEALDETLSGSQRVRNIVGNLKLFSRSPPPQPGLVDVPALLDSCVNMAWGELKHRARLVKDYEAVPPLYGNESLLAQVFVHLILNATQALPPRGGDSAEIRLSTRHEEGVVMVSVHDTGVGIPEEHLERLFDPFFTTKPPCQGTGLGLTLCQSLITQLGGHITVESYPGRGSTFRVFLPTRLPYRSAPAQGTGAGSES